MAFKAVLPGTYKMLIVKTKIIDADDMAYIRIYNEVLEQPKWSRENYIGKQLSWTFRLDSSTKPRIHQLLSACGLSADYADCLQTHHSVLRGKSYTAHVAKALHAKVLN